MHRLAVAPRVNSVAMLAALVSCATLVAACSSSSKSATGPSATGSLTVNVITASGITPSVTVTGPNGYSQSLSATKTLTGLTPGSYTINATGGGGGRGSNPIVDAIDSLTVIGSPASVTASTTATATVSYVLPGTGDLWVVYTYAPVQAQPFSAAQLQAGGTFTAPYTLTFSDFSSEGYGAFDAHHDMWLANAGTNQIEMYAPSQLANSGSLTATVTIGGSALNTPVGLAFDGSGDLWVANAAGNTVLEYTAAQIASSGSPTPTVTLTGFSQPRRLAFDSHGNLWVPNSVSSTVVEFTPSQITSSGNPTPTVTLSATGSSLAAPRGLAFDQSGNLWVANYGGSSVVEFTTSQLTASGSPTPAVTLSSLATSSATAVAFDNSGDLWVCSAASGSNIAEYTPSQIGSSGSPTPTVKIAESVPTGVMFDIPGSGLPLPGAAARVRNSIPR